MKKSREHSQLMDAKLKLNSVIMHFRDDWYWPSWKYLLIEKQRIHHNSQRLLKTDERNRANGCPNGAQLLQQSMLGRWNIIDEQLTSTIPAFVRTGDNYFHTGEVKINAILKSYSLLTLFVTVTFSETWEQFQEILRRKAGDH